MTPSEKIAELRADYKKAGIFVLFNHVDTLLDIAEAAAKSRAMGSDATFIDLDAALSRLAGAKGAP